MLENEKKYKLAIIGDVLELGTHTEEIHKKIEEELINQKNLNVITVGKYTKIINTGIHFNSNKEIIDYLKNKNLENIIILIKGSRGMYLEEIKEYLVKKYTTTISAS
jgi:UDP-N-acetylmuramoyl-tripeptide--D-alanyl-D-alanine ligase